MKEKQTALGAVQLALAMTLSGSIGFFVLQSGQSTGNVVFLRCLIGGLCLLLYSVCKRDFRPSTFTRRNTLLLLLVGVSIVVNWLFFFESYRYISIGLSTAIYHLQPFLIFFAGALFLGETITRQRLSYIVLGFSGLLIMLAPGGNELHEPGYLWGCLLAFAAACFYAIATIASKKLDSVPAHVVALVQLIIGTVILAPLFDVTHLPQTGMQWGSILVVGLIHSALTYILMYSAYQKLDTARIAVLGYIYPVVAVLIDYFAFDRVLTPLQATGGGIILLSGLCSALNVNPFRKRRNVRHPEHV